MSLQTESMWTSFHGALVNGQRWEEFVRSYGPLIQKWAAQYEVQPTDADDLTQNVFLKLTTVVSEYNQDRGQFRGWLHTIVRNEVFNFFRARGRRLKRGGIGAGGEDAQAELEQQADMLASDLSSFADARFQWVENLRAQLTERTWNMVVAFHSGMSAREVGERFGTSVGAVHQAVHRVKLLAQQLDKS